MEPARHEPILLFFRDVERDTFFRNDRYVKRLVRPVYNLFRQGQAVSGFYMWYINLAKALRRRGYRVELNNFRLARQNPHLPVGIVGYPTILNDWDLENSVILGPGMYDHPAIRPDLMEDRRYCLYVVTCQWMRDMFSPVYGEDRVVLWYSGIDTDLWHDTRHYEKPVDVLIYDKVHWDREELEATLLTPIVELIESRGLTFRILRYGQYRQSKYRDLLRQSRAMIFLGEHETQGLAYQEALASNVPIMAWDQGFWLDPRRPLYDPNPVPATSVPYFSAECGERFRDMDEFRSVFGKFWRALSGYEPRRYVKRELSLDGSADLYMKYWSSVRRHGRAAAWEMAAELRSAG